VGKVQIDHNNVDQITNVLQTDRARWQEYLDWMLANFSRVFEWDVVQTGRRDATRTRSIRFYRAALGRQDTCIVFRHRNWVWHRPDAGWTLYVDRRGPALHVRRGMSPSEAWDAFVDFRNQIDAYFESEAA
jgi:hypothetical protein